VWDTPLIRRQLEPGGSGLEAVRTRPFMTGRGTPVAVGMSRQGGCGERSAAYPQRCRRGTAGFLLRRANHSEHGNRPALVPGGGHPARWPG
jgi:hypothetical protein